MEELLPLKLKCRGKVRDVYELDKKRLLIVATDRISAFDCVLPNLIPYKGQILTALSVFWFKKTRSIVENHLIQADFNRFPKELKKYPYLKGRAMLVKQARPILVECVVRGYLSGSAYLAYKKGRPISGIKLPPGLKESDKLPEPIFTPTIKAKKGHDKEIDERYLIRLLGKNTAQKLKTVSLKLYSYGLSFAQKRGIIIADTKFEFGWLGRKLILIDEIFTPDSSRFWPKDEYKPGRAQKSFDKQFVRDYLIKIRWNKKPPAPELPPEVVRKTSQKYLEAYQRLTGKRFLPFTN